MDGRRRPAGPDRAYCCGCEGRVSVLSSPLLAPSRVFLAALCVPFLAPRLTLCAVFLAACWVEWPALFTSCPTPWLDWVWSVDCDNAAPGIIPTRSTMNSNLCTIVGMTCTHQTAVQRLLTRLMIRTMTAITSSRWMRPPAT